MNSGLHALCNHAIILKFKRKSEGSEQKIKNPEIEAKERSKRRKHKSI